jgi:GH24 family phage-related lysozyme (muramidase)
MPYPSNSFDDNKGYPTIGAGHLIKTKEEFETFKQYTLKNITSEENRSANSSVPMQDFLMPEDEMKELFKKDVDIHTQFKSRIKEKITQSMFDALTSIAFNSGWEKNKPIEKIINKRKYKSAHNTIKNLATTSKGEVMQGLVDRRKEEAEMFMKDGFKS